MKPSMGRIVHVRTSQPYNNSDEHPAIINRVWGDHDPAAASGSFVCVNLTVFPDCAGPFTMSSVPLFETRDEANDSGSSIACWWPPRV